MFEKLKKCSLPLVGAFIILVVIILSVRWIQREIRWQNTRKEMDLFEHEILQKITITDSERLPVEMIQSLYDSVMNEETDESNQYNPKFDVLTKEFLKRINGQMNTTFKREDLKSLGFARKTEIEKYGDVIEIAYYGFVIGEEMYQYQYFMNNKMTKTIDRGMMRLNRVIISNENNESLRAVYSEWKSKSGAYFSEPVRVIDLVEYIKLWEKGDIQKDSYITISKINVYRIKVVMLEAENEMRKYLSDKTLAWLYDEVYNKKLPSDMEKAMIDWFDNKGK